MRYLLALCVLLLCLNLQALTYLGEQRFEVNGEQFDMNVFANKRATSIVFEPLVFAKSSVSYADSTVLLFDAPELSISVNVSRREQYMAPASLFRIRALFKQEVYIHELYIFMDGVTHDVTAEFKGVEAIRTGNPQDNKTVMPFTDKAVEYALGASRFWIVASNYGECYGVEGLTDNRVTLYDYRGHFFRYYVNGVSPLLRDCLSLPTGEELSWSFLLFEDTPSLLTINRWLGDKSAALCITNDADMEDVPRLMAAYYGSNNPSHPKYLNEGFFAHNIPVSNTVFGENQATLDGLWTTIMEQGNAIGYHTYSLYADDMALLEQSLLFDMDKYNIRTWIDHALPLNPEDIAYNGANPSSPEYILDMINQSNIDYIWSGETPPTNPFNVYEEAWRLPHKVYEIPGLNRPVWFYGRTRMEAWEYHSSTSIMVSFKYMMTADNLDKLIADRGLHISYTHFCSSNTSTYSSFWTQDINGDYIIRDDVEDMLQMLDYYRENRNLWIATSEDIFDRMLAIEDVQVVSVTESPNSRLHYITLKNASSRNISQLSVTFLNQHIVIPELAAGEYFTMTVSSNGAPSYSLSHAQLRYSDGILTLKNRDNRELSPLTLEIFNIRGQKILTQKLNYTVDKMQIPFENRASGVYFAKIHSDYLLYETARFVVTK